MVKTFLKIKWFTQSRKILEGKARFFREQGMGKNANIALKSDKRISLGAIKDLPITLELLFPKKCGFSAPNNLDHDTARNIKLYTVKILLF